LRLIWFVVEFWWVLVLALVVVVVVGYTAWWAHQNFAG
jgi:hypothetical protein